MNARLVAALSLLLCWLCLAALAGVVATHYPVNHIALDIRVCYVLGVLAVLAAALARAAATLGPVWIWGPLGSGVFLVVVLLILDQWNLLVGYEVWLERGQPAFGAIVSP
jgi:hypothetical protein